jgi:hypothetical protein
LLSAHFLTVEQLPDLGLPESPVATRRADASDSARRCPTRDGLRVDAEQRGHLARCEQTIASFHDPPLR